MEGQKNKLAASTNNGLLIHLLSLLLRMEDPARWETVCMGFWITSSDTALYCTYSSRVHRQKVKVKTLKVKNVEGQNVEWDKMPNDKMSNGKKC
jgi:hypothetical protein